MTPSPAGASPTDFQPATALAYARALAVPRRVGTPGEAVAIETIAGRLSAAGCGVDRQRFTFSPGAEVAVALQVLGALVLILLTFAGWGASAWLGAAPALLLLGLLAAAGRVQRRAAAASIVPPPGTPRSRWQRVCLRLGRHAQSVNVVGRLPAGDGEAARARLYLVAHSDSKSQALPLVARMALFGLAGLLAAAFGLLAVLRPLAPGLTSAAALTGVGALLAGVPVLLLQLAGAGNASPGAIDNASGAGLVLHLAEVLAGRRPNLDVTFLITGAEELGVVGATAYVLAAVREGRLRPAGEAGPFVLNFDGIGSAGRLALVGGGAGGLAALVRACCVDLALPLGRLPLVGALFDHIPFAEAGCDALSLVTVSVAARGVHTPADSVDKLDVEGFRQAGEVALRVIEKLATRPAPMSPTSLGPTAAA